MAHRQEILEQSRATFCHALRDPAFGELWVGGERPDRFEHVFASIQSLNAAGLDHLAPDHFDVVIVDEFHHAAARTYERLLEHLKPRELLGLTATPSAATGCRCCTGSATASPPSCACGTPSTSIGSRRSSTTGSTTAPT